MSFLSVWVGSFPTPLRGFTLAALLPLPGLHRASKALHKPVHRAIVRVQLVKSKGKLKRIGGPAKLSIGLAKKSESRGEKLDEVTEGQVPDHDHETRIEIGTGGQGIQMTPSGGVNGTKMMIVASPRIDTIVGMAARGGGQGRTPDRDVRLYRRELDQRRRDEFNQWALKGSVSERCMDLYCNPSKFLLLASRIRYGACIRV